MCFTFFSPLSVTFDNGCAYMCGCVKVATNRQTLQFTSTRHLQILLHIDMYLNLIITHMTLKHSATKRCNVWDGMKSKRVILIYAVWWKRNQRFEGMSTAFHVDNLLQFKTTVDRIMKNIRLDIINYFLNH